MTRNSRTVFLDLDGPILECRERHYACYAELCRRYGVEPRHLNAYWLLRRRRISAVNLLRSSGAAADESELHRAWIELIEQPRYLKLDTVQPLVAATLSFWKRRELRLILVTLRRNALAARSQLKRLKLEKFFERLVVCDPELGGEGKAAAVQRNAAEAHPSTCVWIGDTEVDAAAAAALGCSKLYLVSCGIRTASYLRSLGIGVVVRDVKSLRERLVA